MERNMAKAQINPVEQRTMLQSQPSNLSYKPVDPNVQLAAGLSQISSNLGNVLYEQNKRLEKLKFADNDEKLKITSGEMNLALSKAKDQAEFDTIKKDYMDRMKNESEARLGKLYDKWNNLEGNNFMAAMDLDVKARQIALNDKIAKETAISTTDTSSYQWAYAKTDEERKVQDAVFNDYLDNSGFNEAEKSSYLRKYNHDKEHGYLTRMITENPTKVKEDLADPDNFNALSVEERESFKGRAESAEKEAKKALDKGFDEKTSLAIGNVKSEQKFELARQIGEIQAAGKGDNIDVDKLNFSGLMGTLDYIDSLSKDPLKMNGEIVKTPSGQITYTLTQEEALKYKEELLPYLMKSSQAVLDGKTGVSTNSVFAEQMARLSEAAKTSGKMTPYQIQDMMTMLWRENKKDEGMLVKENGQEKYFPNKGIGWATRNLEEVGRNRRDEDLRAGLVNVKRVLDEYALKQGNTGVALYTVDPGVTMTITENGKVVFRNKSEQDFYESLARYNEEKQNLSKSNPFIYAFLSVTDND